MYVVCPRVNCAIINIIVLSDNAQAEGNKLFNA